MFIICGLEVYLHHDYIQAKQFQKQAISENELAQQKAALVAFTLKAMAIKPEAKLSEAKKAILAHKIVDVVVKYVADQDAREQYISMIKRESNFDNSVKSPAGAIGLGQVMPATFASASNDCSIATAKEDITNEDINLEVGACYYSLILADNDFNPRLASLEYNGGNKTVEKYKKMTAVNTESANYLILVEQVKELAKK